MAESQISLLVELIDQAFDHKSWHGTNLKGSLRGLDPKTAAFRPRPGRQNIWELILHAAYWKYIARRRLLGEKRGSFALDGSDWFERPSRSHGDAAALNSDIALLTGTHTNLRSAVAALRPKDLLVRPAGSKTTNRDLIMGVASHDLYHAGQIQLLKRIAAR